ncbi:MAG: HAD hydrolase-like protein [Humidesulfovibrio sp.]|nr:HAD hydrolase-like protein [Humidesulfovibrio sp.]
MNQLLFLDLDGPLLDVSAKYHRVYADILEEAGHNSLSLKDYWRAKQAKVPELEILRRTGAEGLFDTYRPLRKERIETDRYLALDRLQPGALAVLDMLRERFGLVLVTLRSSRVQLEKELAGLGLQERLDLVLSSGLETTPRWRIKHDMILERFGSSAASAAAQVGDTETDILAAKALGIFAIGVLSGIRSETILREAGPDRLIDGITGLPEALGDRFKP